MGLVRGEVTVRLWSSLCELAGRETVVVPLLREEATVREVVNRLAESWPEMNAVLPSLLVARDCQYLSLDSAVESGDELSLMPPLSGG
ncbi:MoaD/ThiS family protein [bacterium]|nr:MoaD/ThiS family protein [bacterium]